MKFSTLRKKTNMYYSDYQSSTIHSTIEAYFFLISLLISMSVSSTAQTGVINENPSLDQQTPRYTTQIIDLETIKSQSATDILSSITLPLPNGPINFTLNQNDVLSNDFACFKSSRCGNV